MIGVEDVVIIAIASYVLGVLTLLFIANYRSRKGSIHLILDGSVEVVGKPDTEVSLTHATLHFPEAYVQKGILERKRRDLTIPTAKVQCWWYE
jgi:hypothetical protein